MAGVKKLIFNPLLKGNFEYIKDYDSDLDTLKDSASKSETLNSDTLGKLSEIDTLIKTLQGNLIIPAEREIHIENGQALCDVSFENYKILNNSKKFFVILDNPIVTGASVAAEETVFLKIQTGKQETKTVSPPTVNDQPSETDTFTGFVGYNQARNLSILIDGGFVFFKQGEYATPEIFDKKYSYTIGEDDKAQLHEVTTAVVNVLNDLEEPTEETEEPTTHEETIEVTAEQATLILASRNQATITFELPENVEFGVFGIENEEIPFANPLRYTEGTDQWNTLIVRHKDSTVCKLKDVLAKRTLMRCIIDPNDSSSDDAYIIGGTSEFAPPAEFIKAQAFVIDNLNGNIELTYEKFPSQSVIYIEKAQNSEYSDNASRIIFNDQNTGFTADRSFDIYTGEACAEMRIVHNGTVQDVNLKANQCLKLFFDSSEQQWYILYQGSREQENIRLLHNENMHMSIIQPTYSELMQRIYGGATYDAYSILKAIKDVRTEITNKTAKIIFSDISLKTEIGSVTEIPKNKLRHDFGGNIIDFTVPAFERYLIADVVLVFDADGTIAKRKTISSDTVNFTTIHVNTAGCGDFQLSEEEQTVLNWLIAQDLEQIQMKNEKNKANGYAGLENGKIPKNLLDLKYTTLCFRQQSVDETRYEPVSNPLGNTDITLYHDSLCVPYAKSFGQRLPDLNKIIEPGFYSITGFPTNSPFTETKYGNKNLLLVISSHVINDTVCQIFINTISYPEYRYEFYKRHRNDYGEWTDWQPLFHPKINTLEAVDLESSGVELFPYLMCNESNQQLENMNQVGRIFAIMLSPALSKKIAKLQYIVAQNANSSFEFALYRYTGTFSNSNIPVEFLAKTDVVSNATLGVVEATFETPVQLSAKELYYIVIRTAVGDQIPRLRSANLNLVQDNITPALIQHQSVADITALTSLNFDKKSGQKIVPYIKLY